MKVKYISDLHLGRSYSNLLTHNYISEHPEDDADVLVVAGDLSSISKLKNYKPDNDEDYALVEFINWCDKNFRRTIIVPGNHEFYDGTDLKEFLDGYYFNLTPRVVVASNTIVSVPDPSSDCDVHFVCSTMWSNVTESNIPYVNSCMNDTRLIRWCGSKFLANRFQYAHTVCKDNIVKTLTTLDRIGVPSCKVVVVTHHCPSLLCENPMHEGGPLSSAFIADDMHDTIEAFSPSYWVYGHTHYNKDIDLFDTHIVSNQMGYHEGESSAFSFDKFFCI